MSNRSTFIHTVMVMLLTLATSLSASANPAAGTISLVIGDATILRNQHSLPAIASTPIYSGDRITTQSNGHVHIRFIDQGLISVRPDSILEISHYSYDESNPAQSTIKFALHEGIARSVSGQGAKAARDRFRLNTPIAAIGVRGTDFVVSAQSNAVRALVNEGAIVMAPYSDHCRADALGPCAANGLELGEGTNQIIELERLEQTPRLKPAHSDAIMEQMRLSTQSQTESGEKASKESENVLSHESIVSGSLVNGLPSTPTSLPDADTLNQRQMAWGRWTPYTQTSDTIMLPYQDASRDRRVTVGNNDYALYRPITTSERVQPGLGRVSFNLDLAQATLTQGTATQPMLVRNGALNIDFNTNRFDTRLQLSHPSTGAVDFNAAGRVQDGGYFNSRTASQQLGGAVTVDGQEAGYFFTKSLGSSRIDGTTLWSRP